MAIDVTGLTKRYREKVAVDDISFSVADGGVFAFVGTNGAGKSTTIGCLTTVLPFDAGEVRVRGYDVRHEGDRVREAIGVVFQEPALFSGTIRENIAYGKPEATEDEIAVVIGEAEDEAVAAAQGPAAAERGRAALQARGETGRDGAHRLSLRAGSRSAGCAAPRRR